MTFETVFLDVDGTPVEVSVVIAAEACALDEAGVQQAAASRLETSGLDATSAQGLQAGAGQDGPTVTDDASSADIASGDADATADAQADTAASDPASTPAPGGEPTSAGDANVAAADTPAPGGEPVSVEGSDLTGAIDSAEIASADNLTVPNPNVTEVQSMDSDTTRSEEKLLLAVCQIDATRAADLGLSGIGDGPSEPAD